MNMNCPKCNIELPDRARYFQYYTCKSCNIVHITGKERGVAFVLKLVLAMFVTFSLFTVSLNITLSVAAITLVLAIVLTHLKPPFFRVREPAIVSQPKDKIDVATNIKRYKEEQAKKKQRANGFDNI